MNIRKYLSGNGQRMHCALMSIFTASALLLACFAFAATAHAQVRNRGFGSRGPVPPYFTQENVEKYRNDGWKCPDVADWPQWWWGVYGNPGTLEFPRTGGVQSDGYAKLSGGICLAGYHGLKLEGNQVYTVWVRSKGRLHMNVLSWGQDDAGKTVQLVKPGEAAESRRVEVDSGKWVRYRHLLVKTPALLNVHPFVCAETGSLDIDEVDIVPSTPALDLIVAEEATLYGTGALIENLDIVAADDAFLKKRREYEAAVKSFVAKAASLDGKLAESMGKEIAAIEPYIMTSGMKTVQVPQYNQMLVMTRVLKRLSGEAVAGAEPAVATAVVAQSADNYKSGVRNPRRDAITITGIKHDKILYDENDAAKCEVEIANTSGTVQKGTLVALLHIDLDTVREVARDSVTMAAGGTRKWSFGYNVGPETFGRALEVRCEDAGGKTLDAWKEYYQVAKEWLRVQMHTCGRYWNMNHYFASEPTSFGVRSHDAEEYIAGQGGYRINVAHRQGTIKFWRQRGMRTTFYQNQSFDGIMGYEAMRQHPEYVLYDDNGQFGVDPVYGGYPNPMELASPLEIGPKRQATKPYLDRTYTPWQHSPSNFANPDAVEYFARRVVQYARENNFAGMYLDDVPTIRRGFAYDGQTNLSRDRREIAAHNARIARIYMSILKEDDPNFGTWFNLGYDYPRYLKTVYGPDALLGSGGTPDDVSDEWIRALTEGWKNSAMLMEWSHTMRGSEGQGGMVEGCFQGFCANRDYIVQKYGANAIVGYVGLPMDHKNPGPSKWGWPTINYFMAMGTATQMHLRLEVASLEGTPSLEPQFQFQTRFSRFLWAPDIKVVPEKEIDKLISLSNARDIWWKELAYERKTTNGRDLIVHLLRKPPYEKWDLNWVDEPEPLSGVKVTVHAGEELLSAFAFRAYHFEEEQQTVEQKLTPAMSDGKATVEIPPFRYHTMVVFRVKTK